MLKKIIAVNTSRPNFNTAAMLKQALAGAKSVGAETELINLHDIKFLGCIGCMGCKRKNGLPKKCHQKDQLTPILEKIAKCDGLIVGAPVYFFQMPGIFTSFTERLFYPYFVYGHDYHHFPKKTRSGLVMTMGVTEAQAKDYGLLPKFQQTEGWFKRIFTSLDTLYVHDTRHVADYRKFEFDGQDPAHKYEWHQNNWSKYLEKAFELGKSVARD